MKKQQSQSKKYNIQLSNLQPYIQELAKNIQKKGEKGEKIKLEKFVENNWETNGNVFLEKLKKLGGFLFLLADGHYYFKANSNSQPKRIKQKTQLETLLASALNEPNIQLFKDTKQNPADIYASELNIITIKFTIQKNSEFYLDENDTKCWTKFKPTKYLQINKITNTFKVPVNILFLLSNLCKHREFEFRYVLNWLAGFVQELLKPKTALVFVGEQGAGKNLFVEFVLIPLFGKEFVSIIDNERLNSRFNGAILHEKNLYIFNELSLPNTGSKTVVKNKLKAIITDSFIQVENKGVDPFQAEIVAANIILSNEQVPIDIEEGDRRYVVISTGKNLKKQEVDTNKLVENISSEIEDFATLLQFYEVDWELFDADAPMTEIKESIILNTNQPEKVFVTALKERNIEFFDELQDTHVILYAELKNNFSNNEVLFDSLVKYYQAVYEESRLQSSKSILAKLRLIDPILFAPVKQNKYIRSSNGKKFLKLGD